MPQPEGFTEHLVRGRVVQIERKIWTAPSVVPRPGKAVIFLDAELYLERVEAAQVVEQLQRDGTILPIATAYVSHNSAADRHIDSTCQMDYATFIAKDVHQWVREWSPDVTEIVLAGLSLSGLAAAFAATRFTSAFAATICQSPSFWWEGGRFGKELGPAIEPRPRIWVCVGDHETDVNVSHPPSGLFQGMTQVQGCDAGVAALRQNGYSVSYRTYAGGHDPKCWREDLMLALPWACRNAARRRS